MTLSTEVRKVNIASTTIKELSDILNLLEISPEDILMDYSKKKPEATFNIELPVYPENSNIEDHLREVLQNKAPHSNIQMFPPSESEHLTTIPYSKVNKIWQKTANV